MEHNVYRIILYTKIVKRFVYSSLSLSLSLMFAKIILCIIFISGGGGRGWELKLASLIWNRWILCQRIYEC